jgi:uncharacterized protein
MMLIYNIFFVCETMRTQPTMHELRFNVSQLLKEPTGATRSYEINTKTVGQLDEDVTLVAPISGHVKFLRTGSDILVTGQLETTVQKACGRCLTTFTGPISIELEEEFYPSIDVNTGALLPPPEDADEANRINEQHTLDLLEVVRQNALLESDELLYCRPDCRGLCPHCGQDRNTDPCDCEDDEIDMRWAALQELQVED